MHSNTVLCSVGPSFWLVSIVKEIERLVKRLSYIVLTVCNSAKIEQQEHAKVSDSYKPLEERR